MIHLSFSTIFLASIVASCLGASSVQRTARELDPCDSDLCMNGGSCRSKSESNGHFDEYGGYDFDCLCHPNHYGPRCEMEIQVQDPCVSDPCKNGGSCISTSDGHFKCDCQPDFFGLLCEEMHIIDPCEARPCKNGGSCHSTSNVDFTCHCAAGYSGLLCEIGKEAPAENQECCVGNCENYRGKQSKTVKGLTCQRWDTDKPHKPWYRPGRNPMAGLEENYCR